MCRGCNKRPHPSEAVDRPADARPPRRCGNNADHETCEEVRANDRLSGFHNLRSQRAGQRGIEIQTAFSRRPAGPARPAAPTAGPPAGAALQPGGTRRRTVWTGTPCWGRIAKGIGSTNINITLRCDLYTNGSFV